MNEIFENLYEMTAFSNIIAEPQFLIMYASFGVNPIKIDTNSTVKIPSCAAAPKIERRRLRNIGPKSVNAPTPIKIIGGKKPVLINI